MSISPPRIAVVCDPNGPDADAVRDYVTQRRLDVSRWYPLRDVDDVERDLLSGHFRHVVFASPQDWLASVWSRKIDPDKWHGPEVRIEFVESPPAGANLDLHAVVAQWRAWEGGQRRRRTAAGVILSIIALTVAFLVLKLA